MWIRMSYSRLFRGFPKNSVHLIQDHLAFEKGFKIDFDFCKKCVQSVFIRRNCLSLGNWPLWEFFSSLDSSFFILWNQRYINDLIRSD